MNMYKRYRKSLVESRKLTEASATAVDCVDVKENNMGNLLSTCLLRRSATRKERNSDISVDEPSAKTDLEEAVNLPAASVDERDSNGGNTEDNLPPKTEIQIDLKAQVQRCWEAIEKQVSNYKVPAEYCKPRRNIGKQIVRVFVSSTFTDFHSEREILVKKVFPELREWCDERHLSLLECDLRWGVPKDSTSRETICTCMEELERCHQETHGQPFFLNMLSERYGWIPTGEEVPEDVQEHYDWVPGVSITSMEILLGAYRCSNPNAVFFLRDPAFSEDIPESHRKKFVDDSELSKEHLKVLKRKLKEQFGERVFDYSSKVDGLETTTGREKVRIVGLEDFAAKVLGFFKAAIDNFYPQSLDSEKISDAETEQQLQRLAVDECGSLLCGREKELENLVGFAKGLSDTRLTKSGPEAGFDTEKHQKEMDKWMLTVEDSCPVLSVMAPSGHGKTTLLSCLAQELDSDEYALDVFYHFIGSTSGSVTVQQLMARLIPALGTNESSKFIPAGIATAVEHEQITCLKKMMADADKRDRPLVLILDGLDQFGSNLSWLPPAFPRNVRCIVSCNEGAKYTYSQLQSWCIYSLPLLPLPTEVRKEICTTYLGLYNKRLDSNQLDLLVSHAGSEVALWLSYASEELRVFGDFATLTRKIEGLPETLPGLLSHILDRLITEDTTQLMEKCLCILETSERGLPEEDMPLLLGDLKTGTSVSLLTWSEIRRHLKPFLRTDPGTGAIHFSHLAVRQAVREKLLSSQEEQRLWHTYLADYLDKHCKDRYQVLNQLPLHLLKAQLNSRLVTFIRKDIRAINMMPTKRREYLREICCSNWAQPINSQPLALCGFCSQRPKVLFPGGFASKDMCYLCGMCVTAGPLSKAALICPAHKVPKTAERCCGCGKPTMPKGVELKICTWCASGRHTNKCCKILA